MRVYFLFYPIVAFLLTGCGSTHTQTFTLKPSSFPNPTDMRSGNLSIRFSDKRDDKETIGVVRGGYGNKWGGILIKENLETTMTS